MLAAALLSASACALAPASLSLENRLVDLCAASAPASEIEACMAEMRVAGDGLDGFDALIEGTWSLIHTTKSEFDPANPLGKRVDGTAPGIEGLFPGATGGNLASSSPIQRAVTEAFGVTQSLRGLQATQEASSAYGGRVEQLVSTPLGELHLNAAARVSPSDGRRVLFAFDEGYFESKVGGLRLPYPVPFKLLGKEAEGYLDTSYLSERVRISTGNKGTTFVLKRVEVA